MWESIGLLLIYLVSGYLNKRKKEQKSSDLEQRQESTEELVEDKRFDELLVNLFSDKNSSSTTTESDIIEDGELSGETFIKDQDNIEKIEDKAPIKNKEAFEKQVYHSKLANRKEQQLGNKWNKKEDLKKKYFKSPEMLRKAFILKEILDDPVGLKK